MLNYRGAKQIDPFELDAFSLGSSFLLESLVNHDKLQVYPLFQ